MRRNIILSLVALFISVSFANAQTDDKLFEKKVLMEEFTTEKCSNCPGAAKHVEELMSDEAYSSKIIMVAHHSGFQKDWLTTDADFNLLWYYNSKQTGAPNFMIDRYPYFYTADGKSNPTAVGIPQRDMVKTFKKYIDERAAKKAHVGFEMTAEYTNDTTVAVKVIGKRDMDFAEVPNITIYIIEDKIPARRQAGAPNGFTHRHVTRASNVDGFGDEIKWEGDNFEYKWDFNISNEWKKENLEIVAFVHNLDLYDPTNCHVENARVIPFPTANSIEDASAVKEIVKTEYFTTDGVKTNVLNNGLYIEKKTYSDGTNEVKKIIK